MIGRSREEGHEEDVGEDGSTGRGEGDCVQGFREAVYACFHITLKQHTIASCILQFQKRSSGRVGDEHFPTQQVQTGDPRDWDMTELGRERTQRWEEGGRRQGARQAVEPGQVAAVVYR
jgi:hypothetical protein